jgi:TonB family protein
VTEEPTAQKIGKFVVLDVLGSGGMGVVYRARDPKLNRTVAIKMLKRVHEGVDGEQFERFFSRELTATASLQHKNIVTVYEAGEHDGSPYLVMEYLPGKPLSQVIEERAVLSLAAKLDVVVQVCDGLQYAHSRTPQIIHRDVKPANVILLVDGVAKIVDFGIARVVGSESTVVRTGQLVGSLSYMSPEQINSLPVDARTDIFSIGVLLYQLLTYSLPFDGADTAATLSNILRRDPVPLAKVIEGVPPGLQQCLSRALAKLANDRYQSAGDLAFDLRQIQKQIKEAAHIKRETAPVAAQSMHSPYPKDAETQQPPLRLHERLHERLPERDAELESFLSQLASLEAAGRTIPAASTAEIPRLASSPKVQPNPIPLPLAKAQPVGVRPEAEDQYDRTAVFLKPSLPKKLASSQSANRYLPFLLLGLSVVLLCTVIFAIARLLSPAKPAASSITPETVPNTTSVVTDAGPTAPVVSGPPSLHAADTRRTTGAARRDSGAILKPSPPKNPPLQSVAMGGNLISRTLPVYPVIAKAARVQGTVVLTATISSSGFIKNLRVVSGPPLLHKAALDAVKTWRYTPYLVKGKKTEVETTINVVFNLSN